jgi:5'-3' exonuclease
MSKKLVIFDADSMIFTVAWKFREKNVKNMVTMSLNKFISDVITNSGATHYIGFFGSKKDGAKTNFRFDVDPNYKINRPETPEWVVKWRPILMEAMETKWKFTAVEGMEADDAVAIAAKHFKGEYEEIIVAACDKDLQQIPGITYYNYQKHEKHLINAFDAAMNLGVQLLMGDATDGIKGLDGIGPKKAVAVLSECTTVTQIKWTVARMYAQKEVDLRSKAESNSLKSIIDELTADPSNATLTAKQVERLARIAAKARVATAVFDVMPGGWKKYLRMQSQLLTLLTECPAWFTLPEPVESKLVSSLAQEAKDLDDPAVVEEVKTKPNPRPIDNFLYL